MPEVPYPRRVMVGTDRSDTAEQAVRWAAGFADRFGAELHVVQVVHPEHPSNTESSPLDDTRTVALADDLQQHVRSIAGNRGHGRVVVDEDPAMAMIRAAEDAQIDVLVVGNVGMAGRKEFLLGNVPNRISHNARCTVIIVNTFSADGTGTSARPAGVRSGTLERASQPSRVGRGAEILAVFAKHGLRELFGTPDDEGTTGRSRQAKRLRAALEELGPTFTKIGQLLSTRPDLLPPEFIHELGQLQDHVTPLSEEQVVRLMEQDLGVPWEDVFEMIEPQPLAAGTIAQVHRALLATGNKVVVKVQRPEAKEVIEQDLALLKFFAETVGTRPRVRRFIDLKAVFEHLSNSLQRELDFRLEARNAERMRSALAEFSHLAVPAVYADFSTGRLLVMQDVAGVPVANIPKGESRMKAARQLVESFCKQILINGFFHGDPHPGNLMWQPIEECLYFLDLGMVGEVGAERRDLLILLLMAFWQKDADFLADVMLMLSGAPYRGELDFEAFRQELRSLMAEYRGISVKNTQLGPVLQQLIAASYRHGVPLPASLTLMAKALAQMQLTAAQLDPEIDPFDIAGRYVMRSLLLKIIGGTDAKSLFYQAQKMKVRGIRIIEAFERLIGARPEEKLDLNFRAAALENAVRRAGRLLAFGLAAGFAVLAAALSVTSEHVSGWVPAVFGLAGAVSTVAMVVELLRENQ